MLPVFNEGLDHAVSGAAPEPPPRMHFARRSFGVLELEGDLLCRLAASDVWRLLAPARSNGVRDLVVDLRKVTCVNCVGLGSLLSLRRTWEKSGGRLCFLGASARIRVLIEGAELRRELPCEATEEDAFIRFVRE